MSESDGDPGPALYAAYTGHPASELEALASRLAEVPMSPSLFGGFCGLAWTIAHLDGDHEELLVSIDDALGDWLGSGATAELDLIHGLVGYGVYALEREHAALLARVVGRLAETDLDHVTDLGMAHGLPGVVAFLARAARHGAVGARELLARTSRRLAAIPRFAGAAGAYPARLGDPHPARLAWCYGDPGVAIALAGAAIALGDDRLDALAREIAIGAARRDPATARVDDAGLCHGAAGLAMVFGALATIDPELAAARDAWSARARAFREPDGGFRTFAPDADGVWARRADASLLTGASGIELALAAPGGAWTRIFLVDPLA